jgi:hypothetical protein
MLAAGNSDAWIAPTQKYPNYAVILLRVNSFPEDTVPGGAGNFFASPGRYIIVSFEDTGVGENHGTIKR